MELARAQAKAEIGEWFPAMPKTVEVSRAAPGEKLPVVNTPVVNDSGVVPLGHAVLVLTLADETLKTDKIVLPDEVKDRMNSVETRAIVVDIGPQAWVKEAAPRARVGDKVLIARYSGHLIKGTWNREAYRMINDNDIFAGVTE